MLRKFLYLDESQLDQYVSQVEDGLRQRSSRSQSNSSSKAATADVRVLKGNMGNGRATEVTQEITDTGPAKFERLVQLIDGNEDDFGWLEVLQESDMDRIRVGTLLDVTADLYESEVSKIAGPGGILGMLPLARQVAKLDPSKDSLKGLPTSDQLDTMESFIAAMPSGIILGDVVESSWRIVGQVEKSRDLGALEGDARVVGKVTKIWAKGAWKPLPGLPIISQLPRAERREYERRGPGDGQKMMWVEGPAVQLDVLAVYR